MIRSLLLVLLALTPLAYPVSAEDAEKDVAARKRTKVEHLLELTATRAITVRTMEKTTKAFEKVGLPADFGERFLDRFDIDHVMQFSVDSYVEHLEEETIDAMIVFYESEQGRKLSAALPDLMIDLMEKGQVYGEEVGREVATGR
jgi:hypothetical protein